MTNLVGAALPVTILRATKAASLPTELFESYTRQPEWMMPLSPTSGFVGDPAVDTGVMKASWGRAPLSMRPRGTNSRYGVAGTTRDRYGSVLPGVTVKLFHTADDMKLDQGVSDANGQYLLMTPYYPDTHYLVFYLAGVPDVFGTSMNTLIGS